MSKGQQVGKTKISNLCKECLGNEANDEDMYLL
jgi:hypothetical protein